MNAMADIARAEMRWAQDAWGEFRSWHDRDLPDDYGTHRRKRGETAAMIQACWYAGMRCTSEIARAVGVTPSCVTAHKRRLGLPMIYLNPDLRRKS